MATSVSCQSDSCPNGNPPSRLECPTCNKYCFLNIPTESASHVHKSELESEDRFSVGNYASRVLGYVFIYSVEYMKRRLSEKTQGNNPWPKFNFTGSVRPVYPLSPTREVPAHIPRPDYAEDGVPTSELRKVGQPPRILSPEEQKKMRLVCRLGREVLDIAAAAVRPGITTDEIDEIVHNATIERNSYPSPLNYRNFPKSVCISVNEVICHGIPDKRKLQEGDIVNLDISLYHDGFHADLNETYPVGEIDEESQKLIRTTRGALDVAIAICKPGVLFRDIGKVIEPIAQSNGCAVVRTYTGHGINDLFHGSPNYIPHYAKNKAVGTMRPGMCFTIEPMLNLGHNWGDVHWPDNWTATTVDGRHSAQFEDTLLITETGAEILTRHERPIA